MQHIHPINPYRLRAILAAVRQDHLLAHTLDHLLVHFQKAPLDATGHPTFTSPLAALGRQIGLPSVRALQNRLKKLERLGLISRHARFEGNTKQSVMVMTDQAISQLLPLNEAGKAPVMWQAETRLRYDALLPCLPVTDKTGKPAVLMMMVLNQLIYWIARDANQQGVSFDALESCYCACQLDQLAEACGLGVRALQRILSTLVRAGLITKSKKRTYGPYVETRYAVSVLAWEALKHAKSKKVITPLPNTWRAATVSPKVDSTRSHPIRQQSMEAMLVNKTPPQPVTTSMKAPLPWQSDQTNSPSSQSLAPQPAVKATRSVQKVRSAVQKLRRVTNDHHNKNIDNIFNINNTAYARDKMVGRKPVGNVNVKQKERGQKNKPPTIAHTPLSTLPLNTFMGQNIALNRRQERYVLGMLAMLQKQYHCKFSSPDALFHEVCFALRQTDHIFVGKTGFSHRLNIIAQLLKQKRWTTPYGYERYDARGQAAKSKREAREQAWQRQKEQERKKSVSSRIERTQRLSAAMTRPTPINSSVQWRIREMQALAQRANAADCSDQARAGIRELMLAHSDVIQSHQGGI